MWVSVTVTVQFLIRIHLRDSSQEGSKGDPQRPTNVFLNVCRLATADITIPVPGPFSECAMH